MPLWRILCALILAGALAGPAFGDEFLSYKKPDPKRFAEGVAAYDAHDYAKAYDVWLPLARHGDLAALFNIGLMLRDGRGIAQDLPRALSFFSRCARQEHLACQVNLADMYYKGIGVPQSYAQAARWLTIAARRGHYPSMYKLAGMYERGEGVAVNLDAANVLYSAAAEGGYEPARRRLSELSAAPSNSPESTSAAVGGASGTAWPRGVTTAELPPPPALRGTIGESAADSARPEAATGDPRPRACRDAEAFDALAPMCRMPPVRN